MKPQAELKKLLKTLGYNVKIRTVAVKHPFIQVWIAQDENINWSERQLFDNSLRLIVLKIYYNVETDEQLSFLNILDKNNICYGNIRDTSFSLDVNAIPGLIAAIKNHYGKGNSDIPELISALTQS